MNNNTPPSTNTDLYLSSFKKLIDGIPTQFDTLSQKNPDDKQFTHFDPKTATRFITYINNPKNQTVIPAFVIKSTSRPSFTLNWRNKKIYNPLSISTYDTILPSIPQSIYSALSIKNSFNIDISILGPAGDIVESWKIVNAKLSSVSFSPFSWSDKGNPAEISLSFSISNVQLIY